MSDLYDALEICLQALEEGAELDSALERYPELADALRPVLEASIRARAMRLEPPSADTLRRGRVRLLARAAELRAARKPASRSILPLFQRLAIALTLAAIFLLSGTGLVRASSGSLPGESLYPVKRTWEDLRLIFIINPQHREALESEYENERLQEVYELIQRARVVSITFTGVVTEQQDHRLVVSGVVVDLSAQTQYSGDLPAVAEAVVVTGHTQTDGIVLADSIQTLPPGSLVPTGKPVNIEDRTSVGPGSDDGTNSPSGPDATGLESEDQGKAGSFHLEGTVDSIIGTTWTINGRTVHVENIQIPSALTLGSMVEIEGYFSADGRFIVTKIEVEDDETGEKDGSSADEDEEDGGDDHDGGDSSGDDSGDDGEAGGDD